MCFSKSLNAGVFKPVLCIAFLLACLRQLETRPCDENKKQEVVSMEKKNIISALNHYQQL